jgi:hypothetical protein
MKWSLVLKSKFLLTAIAASTLFVLRVEADDRQIEICTSTQAPLSIRNAVAAFLPHAGEVPLFQALVGAGDAGAIVPQSSEALLDPKAYDQAAHNHLVVIGLESKDALLSKIWGYTTTIDETKKSVYAEGWGYMTGDIGWVESDRNPFLHSQRIKSAPQDTIIVKISGTSEAGVLAALGAFQKGLLNGFVVSGPLSRPQTSLLDLDPNPDPAPVAVPANVTISGKTAMLAGWSELPASEYRGVLEKTKIEPKAMWRYKYLTPGIMEEQPGIRWMGGVHRMAFGNALDIIEFNSDVEASQAATDLAASPFTPQTADGPNVWTAPMSTDEVMKDPFWNITITSSGPYVLLSSLPTDQTVDMAQAFRK